jgi:MAF protein
MQPIVLASTSPFRKALLSKLNLEFVTAAPQVDETPGDGEQPMTLVKRLAIEKAQAVSAQHSRALIIGSDQIVLINGKITGKPLDHQTACHQLRESSGKALTFLTGLCLYNANTGHIQAEVVPFRVHFKTLSATMIENYLSAEQPYQCAGSFKSEGLGIALFERLEGDDPNALVGLPLIRLVEMLSKEGVHII